MSAEICTCSSHCIQVQGCSCGYSAARNVSVRVNAFVNLTIKAKPDLALTEAEKAFLVQCLLSAGEIFSDGLKELRKNGN